MSVRILVLAGSIRAASYNRKLAAEAARKLALTSASVTLIDLADYPLPIFDADTEAKTGVPDNAVKLARILAMQDGLLIAAPEYNASITPLLKNTIDWISRVRTDNDRPVRTFRKLIVGLASASPGRFGGLRGLIALRPVLQTLGAEVLAEQCILANAKEGFDEHGRIADERARGALDRLIEALLEHAQALGRHGY